MSATMMPPDRDVEEAIKAKDGKKFASAFTRLTAPATLPRRTVLAL